MRSLIATDVAAAIAIATAADEGARDVDRLLQLRDAQQSRVDHVHERGGRAGDGDLHQKQQPSPDPAL